MNPQVEEIDYKYVQFAKDFPMHSDLIGNFVIPKGFICDRESVPLFKGTSLRAGYAHDYLYRYDSEPFVPKEIADKVYYEIMKIRGNALWRRYIKYYAVKFFGKSSYHKHRVMATLEELKG